MRIAVFDDIPALFYPITLSRCTGDIRCGVLKLRQRIQELLQAEDEIVVIEPRLANLYRLRHPDWQVNKIEGDTLLVNSRVKPQENLAELISTLNENEALVNSEGSIIAARIKTDKKEVDCFQLISMLKSTKKINYEIELYTNLAQIIHDNSRLLEFDFEHFFYDKDNCFETEIGVTVINPYKVWLGEDTVLKNNVVIDASDGAVIIDEGAEVLYNSVIIGPAYIGKKSIVKVGSKIYGGTSVGPVCKVGGEIEGSIFQAYSNKQHDGFLGHAYLGEWVNIGADTNNSDLKNNYHTVSIHSYETKGQIDTKLIFMGCIIGDHTKIGINCSINTGTVIGLGCNLWGRETISRFVPSFSWGEANAVTKYIFEKFIQTAEVVKKRRDLGLEKAEKELLSQIWKEEL